MLQWQWRKQPVFVSIVDADKRTYLEKWQDREYLKSVKYIEDNKVWRTEILQALSELRNKADVAKTPDELKGLNEGILAIKSIFFSPSRARLQLQALEIENG